MQFRIYISTQCMFLFLYGRSKLSSTKRSSAKPYHYSQDCQLATACFSVRSSSVTGSPLHSCVLGTVLFVCISVSLFLSAMDPDPAIICKARNKIE